MLLVELKHSIKNSTEAKPLKKAETIVSAFFSPNIDIAQSIANRYNKDRLNFGNEGGKMSTGNKILSFEQANFGEVQNLFASEGYFWLSTALATAFALEEMDKARKEEETMLVNLFNRAIRQGMDDEILTTAKKYSLQQVQQLNNWNNKSIVFQAENSLLISKSFTVYWLMYKLIELEWQEVLGKEEIVETYRFLDGILEDRHELSDIESNLTKGETLDEDQKLFLRSHWERAKNFWNEMYIQLNLFALGLMNISAKV